MSDSENVEPSKRLSMLVHAYAIGAGVFLLILGLVFASGLSSAKSESVKRHKARMVGGEHPPAAEGKTPTEVRSGIYVERISVLDVPASSWTVDFYIWFDWEGDRVQPGERFQVMDGVIESKEKIRSIVDGTRHNELYRVTATFTKIFDISRFPVDDHTLMIGIEDSAQNSDELRFVADNEGSSTSSRAKVPGYATKGTAAVVKPHAYKTTRGDPYLPKTHVANFSQLTYGVALSRPDWGLFLKLFLTLYIAVGLSMLVFFIKPTDVDARFGLSVGALFAVVANAYVISGSVPAGGGLSMADLITGVATVTLLLTLIQSTIALTLCHRSHFALADRFDRITLISLTAAFVVVNVMLPLVAA